MFGVGVVYKITSKATDRIYVGSTINPKQRWNKHQNSLKNGKHHSFKLQRDWDEYSSDNFDFVVIEENVSIDQLATREQYWINSYDSAFFGYNVVSVAADNHSEERRSKISKKMKVKAKERIWTEELIEVAKNNLKKIPPRTKEQYQLIAAKNKGQKRSDEFRKQVGNFHRGKKYSEETKKKIGEAGRGREVSQETRNKLRIINTGKKLSEETRKKMSNAQKEIALTKNYDGLVFEKGSAHPNSKLTDNDVYEIKLLLKRGMTQNSIAEIYGVSRGAVGHIKLGTTWSHIIINEDREGPINE